MPLGPILKEVKSVVFEVYFVKGRNLWTFELWLPLLGVC